MLERAPRPAPKQEKIPELTVDETIKGIDFILDHHESLREVWEEKVQDLPLLEQLVKLEDLAAKRREMLAPKPYVSSKLYVLEDDTEFTEKLFNDAIKLVKEKSDEVGRGFNGRVVEYQGGPDADSHIVYKVLTRAPIGEQNDLLSEASYLADLHALSESHKEDSVGVPKPFYCATLSNARVIAMQKVPGLSIERIISDEIALSAEVNLDAIEEKLLDFVNHINESGFYHNDIRPGNIKLDLEIKDSAAPIAYLIDTGNAKYHYTAQGNIDNSKDRVMLKQVFQSLKNYRERQTGKKNV